MAQIVINEISQNYTWNVGSSSYATVALPITACWGPGYVDPATVGKTQEEVLEETAWTRFPATQSGLETFVATYRGPASNYRLAKDNSYQMAMSLLAAGYDVLACRLCPGTFAQGTLTADNGGTFAIKAKYPGTFGNTLQIHIRKNKARGYWNIIIYTVDTSGLKVALENLSFVFDLDHSTDTLFHIDEITSDYITFARTGIASDDITFPTSVVMLSGGTDNTMMKSETEVTPAAESLKSAIEYATARYSMYHDVSKCSYIKTLSNLSGDNTDDATAAMIKYNEWLYTNSMVVYDLLRDKLSYNPNRVISPGWDDQNVTALDGSEPEHLYEISPLHLKLMETAYYSRCATAFIDIPKSLHRAAVYDEDDTDDSLGYAQMLARYVPENAENDINASLYNTHAALFAPWGQYTYAGTFKMADASPSFLALMIHRAMILNQAIQYEWALPTNRKHNLKFGKFAYNVPKKLLDEWQSLEGVGVNVITNIPDLGTTVWGNSTLYEVPPATYQALANLSTRFLMNAVKDVVYRCGIAITFTYNNADAYGAFYAGVTPILDTMKNCGAIDDYLVQMSADINGLDRVNANTVLGKIYLTVNGVINDIILDLVALPPSVDLGQFAE